MKIHKIVVYEKVRLTQSIFFSQSGGAKLNGFYNLFQQDKFCQTTWFNLPNNTTFHYNRRRKI